MFFKKQIKKFINDGINNYVSVTLGGENQNDFGIFSGWPLKKTLLNEIFKLKDQRTDSIIEKLRDEILDANVKIQINNNNQFNDLKWRITMLEEKLRGKK